MKMKAKRRVAVAAPDRRQVERAVYIDFEGTAVEAPSLMGVLIDDEFVQYVFDPSLEQAAIAKAVERGGTCRFMAAPAVLCDLRRLVEKEDRLVFAWSTHERDAIVELVNDPAEQAFWAGTLQNAIPLAKAWKKRHHPDVEFPAGPRGRSGRNALSRYLDLIGYQVPRIHGPGNSASRIRYVRAALARRGRFEALTTVQKNKWANLLKHNRHDCVGLRALLDHVARDAAGPVLSSPGAR
jgi:hypothetical protein